MFSVLFHIFIIKIIKIITLDWITINMHTIKFSVLGICNHNKLIQTCQKFACKLRTANKKKKFPDIR